MEWFLLCDTTEAEKKRLPSSFPGNFLLGNFDTGGWYYGIDFIIKFQNLIYIFFSWKIYCKILDTWDVLFCV